MSLVLLAVLACDASVLSDPRNRSLSGLVVHPNDAHLSPQASEVFRAYGRLAGGDSIPVPVKWTATGGRIDAQGTFYADAAPGQYLVVATHIEKAFLVDTSRVLVENAGVDAVTVSPEAATLQEKDTLRLRASVRDAAGNELADRPVSWASSSPSVATVDATGLVAGVAAGSALMTVAVEGKSDTATITVTRAPVASVTVIPGSGSLVVGDSVRLVAELRDAGGNGLSGFSISWTSAETTVATVSSLGMVRAVAPGTVVISAHADGKQGHASLVFDRVSAASVSVSPSTGSIEERKTIRLTAAVRDAAGNQLTDRLVTWGSTNAEVATVDGVGLVTGVTIGSVLITAATEGKSDTATVTVTTGAVASVIVTPETATVTVGGTRQLTVTLRDAGGTTLMGRPVTWSSISPTLASVDSSGLVRGVASGTALIMATAEGKSDTAAVTVTPVPVASVTVSPATVQLDVGGTQQFTATLRDLAGNVLSGRPVTWSSSDPTIVTVNGSGLATALASGTVGLHATVEGKADTASLTVLGPLGLNAWYVAPNGSATGDGSIQNPWNLDAVLDRGATLAGTRLTSVPNGDGGTVLATIVWVRGGTYGTNGALKTPTLQGTSANPVILRAYPGERVTFDLRFHTINAPDLWFWGIEQKNTSSDLSQDIMGFDLRNNRQRLIHCIVHNNLGNGVGWWNNVGGDSRLYGNLVYNNGRKTSGDPYAHGIYAQNSSPSVKKAKHNVIFHNFDYNIHQFGSGGGQGFTWLQNVMIGWGGFGGGGWVFKATPEADLVIDGMMGYSGSPSTEPEALGQIGADAGEFAARLTLINTYMRARGYTISRWQDATITDNTWLNQNQPMVVENDAGANPVWTYNNNTYFASNATPGSFQFDDSGGSNVWNFADWKTNTGFDATSTRTQNANGHPTTNKVFVFASDYEPKGDAIATQGLIVVFNWQGLASVSVDVSSILSPGEDYSVYHVFDRFGTPVATGTYGGGTISIPMTAVTPPVPTTGWPTGTAPATPGPEFGTFIIVKH